MGGSGGYFAGGEWRYDANHNQIISVTNSGTKPADALLTLHYDNGGKKYEMQQTIQPGDQMWVNLSQLVRQRIPDRTGNTLPVDVSSVTYDLRDLTPRSHNLTMGELAVGGAWGFQAVQPPCPECCGQDVLGFSPNPVDLLTENTDTVAIDGIQACNGNPAVLTPDYTLWGSDNTGGGHGELREGAGRGCGLDHRLCKWAAASAGSLRLQLCPLGDLRPHRGAGAD